ncbi:MAG: YidC/Oxa1 family membrane protein insertase [Acidimicrobiales bacterium]
MILAENALFHDVGRIFQPIFDAVGWALAFIYGIIPNYAVAIALLTVVIMLLLTPLTVKSTRSMVLMQAMQPEIKKLQQKYKGAENRQKLNEEMMALYKERHINPAGGCLPMFLQMPFLIILYDTIRGLTNVVTKGHHLIPQPRYIPKPTGASIGLVDKLYHNLVHASGQMISFGMNLADKPFSHGLSGAARVPFFVLVALAVGLQYFQMTRMNSRNSQAAANRQMQTIQKVTPILFAYIYFLVPAAVVIYMVVSTLIRIGTQEFMFRSGMVTLAPAERKIQGGTPPKGLKAAPAALVERGDDEADKPAPKTNGSGPKNRAGSGNGKANTNGSGSTNGTTEPKPGAHPRARGKRPRKAR